MTRLDDAFAIVLYVMLLVGLPFVVKAIPVLFSALVGDYVSIYAFWDTGFPLVLLGSLLFCGVLLIVGKLLD